MKIIDLLNRIANHEEVPLRIKYDGLIFEWDKVGYLHYRDNKANECAFLEGVRTDMVLNDEVELIGDKEDEIDIQNIEEIDEYFIEITNSGEDVKFLAKKYNELIKVIKQLDKKIKEK
jgi:hypothetical protein